MLRFLRITSLLLFAAGLFFLSGLARTPAGWLLHRTLTDPGAMKLRLLGAWTAAAGLLLLLFERFLLKRLRGWLFQIKNFEKSIETRLYSWIETHSNEWLVFGELTEKGRGAPEPLINRFDIAVTAGLALFALVFFLGRVQGTYPKVDLYSDAANIASFAAAYDHPQLFQGDGLLSDFNNIRYYATIHIPLVRFLAKPTGNYGMGLEIMLGPHVFLLFIGFYLLGRIIFHSRGWALALALLNLLPYPLNLQENWGIFDDVVPRFTFQAALPFLLILAWMWHDKPRRWPIISIMSGLLVYVHPVSAPAWMAALWLGFLPFLPPAWSLVKKLGIWLGLGLLEVLVALPFALNYLGFHVKGAAPDYAVVMEVINNYYAKNILNIPAAWLDFMGKTPVLIPLALLALLTIALLQKSNRAGLSLLLAWTFGIVLVSLILPWIEHSIEQRYRLVPLQTELTRDIRYLVPIMLLLVIWALVELQRRLKKPAFARGIAWAGASLVVAWALVNPPYPEIFKNALDCFSQGRLICSWQTDTSLMLSAVETQLPAGAPIFTSGALDSRCAYGICLRYQTLHPVVFAFKDRGQLISSNTEQLVEWSQTYLRLEKLSRSQDLKFKVREMAAIARNQIANYMLLDFPVESIYMQNLGLRIIYQNDSYILVEIR